VVVLGATGIVRPKKRKERKKEYQGCATTAI
jgi:hypothetical protein